MAATLHVACGVVVAVAALALPYPAGVNRRGLVAVAVLAVLAGTVIWRLPWERWGRNSTLAVIPVAFAAHRV